MFSAIQAIRIAPAKEVSARNGYVICFQATNVRFGEDFSLSFSCYAKIVLSFVVSVVVDGDDGDDDDDAMYRPIMLCAR